MPLSFTKRNWKNKSQNPSRANDPQMQASDFNRIEQGIKDAVDAINLLQPVSDSLVLSQITREQTIVPLGDSITAQDINLSAGPSTSARGYLSHAQAQLRSRFLVLNNAGVGGNTYAQILARIQTDVIAFNPGYCIVQGGGNDVAQGRTAAAIIADLTSIFTLLKAYGIIAIATTILPTTSANDSTKKGVLHTVNNWIRDYARAHPWMILCDWYASVADPATGDPATNMTYDGITHPSQMGAYTLGTRLAQVLEQAAFIADPLPEANAESVYTLPNPRMTGNTAGVATATTVVPVTGTPTLVKTKVPRNDGIVGEWQQVTASGAADFWYIQQQASLNIGAVGAPIVGDYIYAVAEVEIDPGATMVGIAGETPACLRIVNQDAAGTPSVSHMFSASSEGLYPGPVPSGRFVFRTPNYLLPAASSREFVRLILGINGTVRLGRIQIYKAAVASVYG